LAGFGVVLCHLRSLTAIFGKLGVAGMNSDLATFNAGINPDMSDLTRQTKRGEHPQLA
jgi:hypothetical protein